MRIFNLKKGAYSLLTTFLFGLLTLASQQVSAESSSVKVYWSFDQGTARQQPTVSGNLSSVVSTSITAGSHLTFGGTKTLDNGLTETRVGVTQSNESAATNDNKLSFRVQVADGYGFIINKVSFKATRIGTDGVSMDVSVAGKKVATGLRPARNKANPEYTTYSYTVSNEATSGHNLSLNIYNLLNTKQVGLADITIEGTIVKTTSSGTSTQESGSVYWPFELGTANQAAQVAGDLGGKLTASVQLGSNLTWGGVKEVSGLSESRIGVRVNNESSANESNALKFVVSAKTGYTVQITKVQFSATRIGTDAGSIDVTVGSKLATALRPARNKANPEYTTYTYTADAQAQSSQALVLNLYNLGITKQFGIAHVTLWVKVDKASSSTGTGSQSTSANDFETAAEAVANMGIGWNAGNALESNSNEVNGWIEKYTDRSPKAYETAWGQPQIDEHLIKAFKEQGFNAIRVPVTWWPHMDSQNKIDATWMARVKQVVDYVVGNGMYCILNVHHDTGATSSGWLNADMANFSSMNTKFQAIWKQIANTFKDYDQHLLFEGYNEMLDAKKNWNAPADVSDLEAINKFAQSFVNTVRATGGNNARRNLIVNTYAAAYGGSWGNCPYVLSRFKEPADNVKGHIAVEVHSYAPYSWAANNNLRWTSSCDSEIKNMYATLKSNFIDKGYPVIIGEYGPSTDGLAENFDYTSSAWDKACAPMATSYVKYARQYGVAAFYWMGLTTGKDRAQSTFKWTMPRTLAAIKSARGITAAKANLSATTGIDEVQAAEPASGAWYTINGVRVEQPSQPGIYIRNGKKIIVR